MGRNIDTIFIGGGTPTVLSERLLSEICEKVYFFPLYSLKSEFENNVMIIKERPEDPIESLAMYLVKNNPNTPELRAKLDISEFQ